MQLILIDDATARPVKKWLPCCLRSVLMLVAGEGGLGGTLTLVVLSHVPNNVLPFALSHTSLFGLSPKEFCADPVSSLTMQM